VRALGKNPANTHIVIQEIERENWGHAGALVDKPREPGKA
jgi:4-oxalocrotonate tautomerase